MGDTGLRHNRDFQILCAAQGLSRLGTHLSAIAFPLLVLHVTGSAKAVGIVAFAEGIALAITLLPGGVIADRWRRRAVMAICAAACATIMAIVASAVAVGYTPLPLLVVAGALTAGLGGAFAPAAGATLRMVVPDKDYRQAVSINQARNAAILLVGPALGGLLFQVSPALPFLADAVTYGVAFAGALILRVRQAGAPAQDRQSPLAALVGGVRFLFQHPILRFTLIASALANFAFSGVLLSVIISVVQRGSTGLTIGAVIGFVGAGSLVGSLMAPAISRRLSLRQALFAVSFPCGLLVAGMALTHNIVILAVLLAICVLLVPTLNVITASTRALLTPDNLQGRVGSSTSFVAMSVSPLGPLLAGLLLDRWPVYVAFLTFAAVLLAMTIAIMLTTSLRETDSDQTAQPDEAMATSLR